MTQQESSQLENSTSSSGSNVPSPLGGAKARSPFEQEWLSPPTKRVAPLAGAGEFGSSPRGTRALGEAMAAKQWWWAGESVAGVARSLRITTARTGQFPPTKLIGLEWNSLPICCRCSNVFGSAAAKMPCPLLLFCMAPSILVLSGCLHSVTCSRI